MKKQRRDVPDVGTEVKVGKGRYTVSKHLARGRLQLKPIKE